MKNYIIGWFNGYEYENYGGTYENVLDCMKEVDSNKCYHDAYAGGRGYSDYYRFYKSVEDFYADKYVAEYITR